MSSSSRMGEITRVNLSVERHRKSAFIRMARCASGTKRSDVRMLAVPGAVASLLASGLTTRFEASRLSPEIEADNNHDDSKVVRDPPKSSQEQVYS
jgi:hypothetical protein